MSINLFHTCVIYNIGEYIFSSTFIRNEKIPQYSNFISCLENRALKSSLLRYQDKTNPKSENEQSIYTFFCSIIHLPLNGSIIMMRAYKENQTVADVVEQSATHQKPDSGSKVIVLHFQ